MMLKQTTILALTSCALGLVLLTSPQPATAVCVGDCGPIDDVVSIPEVQTCINIVSGAALLSTCPNCDENGDQIADMTDLGFVVDSYLGDATTCPQVTAAPTPTPGAGLGERVFTIAEKPASGFFSSGLNGADVSAAPPAFSSGPIRLVAGSPDGNGQAPITLAADAIFSYRVLDQSIVCTKIFQAGTSGFVDCDGNALVGVQLSGNSNGDLPEDPPVLTTGNAPPRGAGSVLLNAMTSSMNLSPMRCSVTTSTECTSSGQCPVGETCVSRPVSDCLTEPFDEPTANAFTSGAAVGLITNVGAATLNRSCSDNVSFCTSSGTGCPVGTTCTSDVILGRLGQAFDCANWTVTDGPGKLVHPIIGFDSAIAGDTVQILSISDP